MYGETRHMIDYMILPYTKFYVIYYFFERKSYIISLFTATQRKDSTEQREATSCYIAQTPPAPHLHTTLPLLPSLCWTILPTDSARHILSSETPDLVRTPSVNPGMLIMYCCADRDGRCLGSLICSEMNRIHLNLMFAPF